MRAQSAESPGSLHGAARSHPRTQMSNTSFFSMHSFALFSSTLFLRKAFLPSYACMLHTGCFASMVFVSVLLDVVVVVLVVVTVLALVTAVAVVTAVLVVVILLPVILQSVALSITTFSSPLCSSPTESLLEHSALLGERDGAWPQRANTSSLSQYPCDACGG